MKSPSLQQQDEEFREALRVVPVRNRRVRAEPAPDDPDCLVVEVELRYRTRLMRLLRDALHASAVRKYRLDRLGTAVYRMIDDRKTYEQLADEFAAREKLTFFEARALLGQFFQHLAKRGLIVAALPKGAPSPSTPIRTLREAT